MNPQQQLEALSSPDVSVRLSALQSLVDDPAALESGGPDLVEGLLALAQQEERPILRRLLTALLACSHGPAVTEFLLAEMQHCDDEMALDLGRRLATEPLAHLQALAVLMFEAEREAVRLAAALALQAVDGVPSAIHLRRDLLLDRDGEWVLYHDDPEAWLDELRGPLAERAWRRVDRPLALWDHWHVLDEASRRRLVRRTAQQAPAELLDRLARLRRADDLSDPVVIAALESGREAGLDTREEWPALVARFLDRPALGVRAAVVAGGGFDEHLLTLVADTALDPTLRVAALRRWVVVAGAEAEPTLREALEDEHWAVRAAAQGGLEALAEG